MRSLPKPVFAMMFAGAIAADSIAQTNGVDNAAATPMQAQPTNAAGPSAAPVPPAVAMPASPPQSSVFPGRHPFGAGVLAGEPTGLSLKYWLSDRFALDGGAGYSFEGGDSFQLHSDVLMHKFDLFQMERGELPLYFGVGGRLKFPEHGDNVAGVRFPVGVAYLFPDSPLELFAEVAPIIDVAPVSELRWNGGIGIRYYFW